MVLAGDPSEVFSLLDLVDDPHSVSTFLDLPYGHRVEEDVSLMPVEAVLVLYEAAGILIRDPEDVFPFMSRNDLMTVLWVEVLELVQRRSCHFAHLLQVQLSADDERIDARRHSHSLRLHSVLLVVFQCIQGSDKCRHI